MLGTLKRLPSLPSIFAAGVLAVFLTGNKPAATCAQGSGAKESEKEILIETPWGGLEAAATPDPSRLALPLYPGARMMKDQASDSLSIDLSIGGKSDVHFIVGKFERRTESRRFATSTGRSWAKRSPSSLRKRTTGLWPSK